MFLCESYSRARGSQGSPDVFPETARPPDVCLPPPPLVAPRPDAGGLLEALSFSSRTSRRSPPLSAEVPLSQLKTVPLVSEFIRI